MHITLSPRRLLRFLLWAIGSVAVLGLLSETAYYLLDFEGDEYLMQVFSLSMEHNFPTWFSAGLHVLCGGLLAVIACSTARARGPFVRHWAFLSAAFFYISLDETVTIHEQLNGLIDAGDGLLTYGWILPAGAVLIVLGAVYGRFLLHLPSSSRNAFLIAGTLFVGGAVGMELPLGLWSTVHGSDNMGYVLIDSVEETLELLGVSLFLVALVRHLGGEDGRLSLHLADDTATAVLSAPTGAPAPENTAESTVRLGILVSPEMPNVHQVHQVHRVADVAQVAQVAQVAAVVDVDELAEADVTSELPDPDEATAALAPEVADVAEAEPEPATAALPATEAAPTPSVAKRPAPQPVASDDIARRVAGATLGGSSRHRSLS